MSLSDKSFGGIKDNYRYCELEVVSTNDVKEAIKELLERRCWCEYETKEDLDCCCHDIKEIFGEELMGEHKK